MVSQLRSRAIILSAFASALENTDLNVSQDTGTQHAAQDSRLGPAGDIPEAAFNAMIVSDVHGDLYRHHLGFTGNQPVLERRDTEDRKDCPRAGHEPAAHGPSD